MKKPRRKKIAWILGILMVVAVVQTLPAFFPTPLNSETMADETIHLSYQPGDERGAREVFDLLKRESASIYEKMDYQSSEPIEVYLYKTQASLAIREAGLITLAIAPPWHIGDSHNGNIMLVSPYTSVESHTHDSILNAALHELVHAINFHINPDMSYFWDNGLATYLSGQVPRTGEYDPDKIPSLADMHTENGLKFGNMGGYAYSYLYIQYLDEQYGWDKVVAFAKDSGDYMEIFGKTEEALYTDWVDYLKSGR